MLTKVKVVAVVSVFLAILMMPLAHGQQTILVANFVNGDTTIVNSRVYLWNPSNAAGNITVRAFTLPLTNGLQQELTTTPLFVGTLGPKSALNIKLAENILTPLGMTTPYVTDGGNLTLEFTIGADNVGGTAQVFTDSFAFGTYPLQTVELTASSSGGDDHGNDCVSATSVSVNSTRDGSIETGGDSDFFQIQVPSSGTLTVYTNGSTDTFGELRDSACSIIASNDDSDSVNFRIGHAVSSGTYYVTVRHFDNSSGTGSYTLNVELTP
jgi:hypothetical protein